MSDPFAALAVSASFATFGKRATYTPPGGGTAFACRVIQSSQDRQLGGLGGRPILRGDTLEVRASEVTPARDGQFVLAATGETFTVLDDPRTEDHDRLVWLCTVR